MKNSKCLLISEIFPPHVGGSGRWFWEVYRRMAAGTCVVAAGEHEEQAEFDARSDVHIERVPLSMRQWGLRSWEGIGGYWTAVRRLRTLVGKYQVNYVHCGRCIPEGVMAYALKWLCGLPYVCYVHGEDVGTAGNSREHAMLVRRVLKSADLCIANSQNSRKLLTDEWGIDESKTVVLHPGVDARWFTPAARSETARNRLGWGDRPVLLTVGRLQRRKGQDQMIRALPLIRQQFPNVLYAVVGGGEDRTRLEQLVAALNLQENVRLHGELGDELLLDCYRQCDLFALPNRELDGDIEGFGMVLVEAQACGKPVIAGRSGGTSETMIPGKTGLVVPCETPEPLAEAVLHLLENDALREQMGADARRWAADHFEWETLAGSARELFHRSRASFHPAGIVAENSAAETSVSAVR